jgi:hypothetical protein
MEAALKLKYPLYQHTFCCNVHLSRVLGRTSATILGGKRCSNERRRAGVRRQFNAEIIRVDHQSIEGFPATAEAAKASVEA